MHAGVIRDEQRMRTKRERQLDSEIQQELEKEYKKSQSVSSVIGAPSAGCNGEG